MWSWVYVTRLHVLVANKHVRTLRADNHVLYAWGFKYPVQRSWQVWTVGVFPVLALAMPVGSRIQYAILLHL